ncbi:hypothetical protein B0H14DRAFT_3534924 [Mycena olivaceomarginata]|nr:hypothetical protein B0H14DRAFT_3534924 [Mycena olivaceomarginata]
MSLPALDSITGYDSLRFRHFLGPGQTPFSMRPNSIRPGDPVYLTGQPWTVPLHLFAGAMVAILVQSFLVYAGVSLFAHCIILTVRREKLGGSFACGVMTALFPAFKDRERVAIPVLICLVTEAVVDINIAATLLWQLRKARPNLVETRSVLDRLVTLTIQTGTATAALSVGGLVAYGDIQSILGRLDNVRQCSFIAAGEIFSLEPVTTRPFFRVSEVHLAPAIAARADSAPTLALRGVDVVQDDPAVSECAPRAASRLARLSIGPQCLPHPSLFLVRPDYTSLTSSLTHLAIQMGNIENSHLLRNTSLRRRNREVLGGLDYIPFLPAGAALHRLRRGSPHPRLPGDPHAIPRAPRVRRVPRPRRITVTFDRHGTDTFLPGIKADPMRRLDAALAAHPEGPYLTFRRSRLGRSSRFRARGGGAPAHVRLWAPDLRERGLWLSELDAGARGSLGVGLELTDPTFFREGFERM